LFQTKIQGFVIVSSIRCDAFCIDNILVIPAVFQLQLFYESKVSKYGTELSFLWQ